VSPHVDVIKMYVHGNGTRVENTIHTVPKTLCSSVFNFQRHVPVLYELVGLTFTTVLPSGLENNKLWF